jgi:preprotein translocase subunit SecD
MIQAPKARTSVIVGVLLLAAYGIIGLPKSVDELKANLKNNIRLGLDLKGGSFLVLEVQVQDAMKAEADRTIESLKEDLRKNGIDYAGMERNDPSTVKEADSIQINIKGVSGSKVGDLRNLINTSRYASWFLTGVSPTEYRLNMKPTDLIALKKDTLDQTKQTIEHRINGLGVGETTIQERRRADAEFELVVELPGVDDPARVKGIMQTAAMLELCSVKGGPYSSRDDALAKNGGVLPLDSKLVRGSARGEEGNGEIWYLLGRTAVVTGRDLRNARPSRGELGRWETDFVLGKDGSRRFARFTESNIGNRLAIVLDNQVRSAPTIQNRIEDSGRITGAANEQDASDLALVLREGSLPAGIQYPEERTVGPSLGADSIRQGLIAGMVGLGAVILAMLIYYKGAGVNAVLALFLNTVILLAVLSYVGAVLTLPGIAGMILTVGMAVDSNVLIFERIREELRAGNGVVPAVAAGFNKAFRTIVDTHVTTVVSCAFLFMFGTGPVKGFAVTLVIGLLANVFTAVVVSRAMFDWHINRQSQVTELSI